MAFRDSWRSYEDWRIRRCQRSGGAVDLLGGALLLPAGVWLLWHASAALDACGGEPMRPVVGALLLALGVSSLGRAFWSRLVARLAGERAPRG